MGTSYLTLTSDQNNNEFLVNHVYVLELIMKAVSLPLTESSLLLPVKMSNPIQAALFAFRERARHMTWAPRQPIGLRDPIPTPVQITIEKWMLRMMDGGSVCKDIAMELDIFISFWDDYVPNDPSGPPSVRTPDGAYAAIGVASFHLFARILSILSTEYGVAGSRTRMRHDLHLMSANTDFSDDLKRFIQNLNNDIMDEFIVMETSKSILNILEKGRFLSTGDGVARMRQLARFMEQQHMFDVLRMFADGFNHADMPVLLQRDSTYAYHVGAPQELPAVRVKIEGEEREPTPGTTSQPSWLTRTLPLSRPPSIVQQPRPSIYQEPRHRVKTTPPKQPLRPSVPLTPISLMVKPMMPQHYHKQAQPPVLEERRKTPSAPVPLFAPPRRVIPPPAPAAQPIPYAGMFGSTPAPRATPRVSDRPQVSVLTSAPRAINTAGLFRSLPTETQSIILDGHLQVAASAVRKAEAIEKEKQSDRSLVFEGRAAHAGKKRPSAQITPEPLRAVGGPEEPVVHEHKVSAHEPVTAESKAFSISNISRAICAYLLKNAKNHIDGLKNDMSNVVSGHLAVILSTGSEESRIRGIGSIVEFARGFVAKLRGLYLVEFKRLNPSVIATLTLAPVDMESIESLTAFLQDFRGFCHQLCENLEREVRDTITALPQVELLISEIQSFLLCVLDFTGPSVAPDLSSITLGNLETPETPVEPLIAVAPPVVSRVPPLPVRPARETTPLHIRRERKQPAIVPQPTVHVVASSSENSDGGRDDDGGDALAEPDPGNESRRLWNFAVGIVATIDDLDCSRVLNANDAASLLKTIEDMQEICKRFSRSVFASVFQPRVVDMREDPDALVELVQLLEKLYRFKIKFSWPPNEQPFILQREFRDIDALTRNILLRRQLGDHLQEFVIFHLRRCLDMYHPEREPEHRLGHIENLKTLIGELARNVPPEKAEKMKKILNKFQPGDVRRQHFKDQPSARGRRKRATVASAARDDDVTDVEAISTMRSQMSARAALFTQVYTGQSGDKNAMRALSSLASMFVDRLAALLRVVSVHGVRGQMLRRTLMTFTSALKQITMSVILNNRYLQGRGIETLLQFIFDRDVPHAALRSVLPEFSETYLGERAPRFFDLMCKISEFLVAQPQAIKDLIDDKNADLGAARVGSFAVANSYFEKLETAVASICRLQERYEQMTPSEIEAQRERAALRRKQQKKTPSDTEAPSGDETTVSTPERPPARRVPPTSALEDFVAQQLSKKKSPSPARSPARPALPLPASRQPTPAPQPEDASEALDVPVEASEPEAPPQQAVIVPAVAQVAKPESKSEPESEPESESESESEPEPMVDQVPSRRAGPLSSAPGRLPSPMRDVVTAVPASVPASIVDFSAEQQEADALLLADLQKHAESEPAQVAKHASSENAIDRDAAAQTLLSIRAQVGDLLNFDDQPVADLGDMDLDSSENEAIRILAGGFDPNSAQNEAVGAPTMTREDLIERNQQIYDRAHARDQQHYLLGQVADMSDTQIFPELERPKDIYMRNLIYALHVVNGICLVIDGDSGQKASTKEVVCPRTTRSEEMFSLAGCSQSDVDYLWNREGGVGVLQHFFCLLKAMQHIGTPVARDFTNLLQEVAGRLTWCFWEFMHLSVKHTHELVSEPPEMTRKMFRASSVFAFLFVTFPQGYRTYKDTVKVPLSQQLMNALEMIRVLKTDTFVTQDLMMTTLKLQRDYILDMPAPAVWQTLAAAWGTGLKYLPKHRTYLPVYPDDTEASGGDLVVSSDDDSVEFIVQSDEEPAPKAARKRAEKKPENERGIRLAVAIMKGMSRVFAHQISNVPNVEDQVETLLKNLRMLRNYKDKKVTNARDLGAIAAQALWRAFGDFQAVSGIKITPDDMPDGLMKEPNARTILKIVRFIAKYLDVVFTGKLPNGDWIYFRIDSGLLDEVRINVREFKYTVEVSAIEQRDNFIDAKERAISEIQELARQEIEAGTTGFDEPQAWPPRPEKKPRAARVPKAEPVKAPKVSKPAKAAGAAEPEKVLKPPQAEDAAQPAKPVKVLKPAKVLKPKPEKPEKVQKPVKIAKPVKERSAEEIENDWRFALSVVRGMHLTMTKAEASKAPVTPPADLNMESSEYWITGGFGAVLQSLRDGLKALAKSSAEPKISKDADAKELDLYDKELDTYYNHLLLVHHGIRRFALLGKVGQGPLVFPAPTNTDPVLKESKKAKTQAETLKAKAKAISKFVKNLMELLCKVLPAAIDHFRVVIDDESSQSLASNDLYENLEAMKKQFSNQEQTVMRTHVAQMLDADMKNKFDEALKEERKVVVPPKSVAGPEIADEPAAAAPRVLTEEEKAEQVRKRAARLNERSNIVQVVLAAILDTENMNKERIAAANEDGSEEAKAERNRLEDEVNPLSHAIEFYDMAEKSEPDFGEQGMSKEDTATFVAAQRVQRLKIRNILILYERLSPISAQPEGYVPIEESDVMDFVGNLGIAAYKAFLNAMWEELVKTHLTWGSEAATYQEYKLLDVLSTVTNREERRKKIQEKRDKKEAAELARKQQELETQYDYTAPHAANPNLTFLKTVKGGTVRVVKSYSGQTNADRSFAEDVATRLCSGTTENPVFNTFYIGLEEVIRGWGLYPLDNYDPIPDWFFYEKSFLRFDIRCDWATTTLQMFVDLIQKHYQWATELSYRFSGAIGQLAPIKSMRVVLQQKTLDESPSTETLSDMSVMLAGVTGLQPRCSIFVCDTSEIDEDPFDEMINQHKADTAIEMRFVTAEEISLTDREASTFHEISVFYKPVMPKKSAALQCLVGTICDIARTLTYLVPPRDEDVAEDLQQDYLMLARLKKVPGFMRAGEDTPGVASIIWDMRTKKVAFMNHFRSNVNLDADMYRLVPFAYDSDPEGTLMHVVAFLLGSFAGYIENIVASETPDNQQPCAKLILDDLRKLHGAVSVPQNFYRAFAPRALSLGDPEFEKQLERVEQMTQCIQNHIAIIRYSRATAKLALRDIIYPDMGDEPIAAEERRKQVLQFSLNPVSFGQDEILFLDWFKTGEDLTSLKSGFTWLTRARYIAVMMLATWSALHPDEPAAPAIISNGFYYRDYRLLDLSVTDDLRNRAELGLDWINYVQSRILERGVPADWHERGTAETKLLRRQFKSLLNTLDDCRTFMRELQDIGWSDVEGEDFDVFAMHGKDDPLLSQLNPLVGGERFAPDPVDGVDYSFVTRHGFVASLDMDKRDTLDLHGKVVPGLSVTCLEETEGRLFLNPFDAPSAAALQTLRLWASTFDITGGLQVMQQFHETLFFANNVVFKLGAVYPFLSGIAQIFSGTGFAPVKVGDAHRAIFMQIARSVMFGEEFRVNFVTKLSEVLMSRAGLVETYLLGAFSEHTELNLGLREYVNFMTDKQRFIVQAIASIRSGDFKVEFAGILPSLAASASEEFAQATTPDERRSIVEQFVDRVSDLHQHESIHILHHVLPKNKFITRLFKKEDKKWKKIRKEEKEAARKEASEAAEAEREEIESMEESEEGSEEDGSDASDGSGSSNWSDAPSEAGSEEEESEESGGDEESLDDDVDPHAFDVDISDNASKFGMLTQTTTVKMLLPKYSEQLKNALRRYMEIWVPSEKSTIKFVSIRVDGSRKQLDGMNDFLGNLELMASISRETGVDLGTIRSIIVSEIDMLDRQHSSRGSDAHAGIVNSLVALKTALEMLQPFDPAEEIATAIVSVLGPPVDFNRRAEESLINDLMIPDMISSVVHSVCVLSFTNKDMEFSTEQIEKAVTNLGKTKAKFTKDLKTETEKEVRQASKIKALNLNIQAIEKAQGILSSIPDNARTLVSVAEHLAAGCAPLWMVSFARSLIDVAYEYGVVKKMIRASAVPQPIGLGRRGKRAEAAAQPAGVTEAAQPAGPVALKEQRRIAPVAFLPKPAPAVQPAVQPAEPAAEQQTEPAGASMNSRSASLIWQGVRNLRI